MELAGVPMNQVMSSTVPPSRRRAPLRGRRVRLAALAAGLALVPGLLGGPASAQDPPPTTTSAPAPVGPKPGVVTTPSTTVPGQADPDAPPTTPEAVTALFETLAAAPEQPDAADDAFVAVVAADKDARDLAMARLGAQDRARVAAVQLLDATKARDVARLKALAAKQVRDDAAHELAVERKRLSDLTVRAYVTGATVDIDKYRDLLRGDTSDPAAGRQIMFSQVLKRQQDVTETARKALIKARKRLAAARRLLKALQATKDQRQATAQARNDDASSAAASHQAAVDAAAAARRTLVASAASTPSLIPLESSLIGLPRLTPDDLAGWFEATSYRPRVATPITDYAKWFIDEGRAEGIRGDIAFAQAVLETGGFANTDSVVANNFSGIGHCDSCPSGWSFPNPHLGVRAQIQLLKSYAVKKPAYVSPLVDKRLRGPAGCCPTWGDLTTVWATDPGYGPKVMLIYTAIVDYALKRRARGEGLEPTY